MKTMKKNLLKTLVGAFIFLNCLNVYSSSPISSSITYRHISGGKYTVIIKLYRDCKTDALDLADLIIRNDSFQINVTPVRTSIKDISLFKVKNSLPCNPQNQASVNGGIEEHTLEYTVNFDSSYFNKFKNRCKVWFAYYDCCRTSPTTLTQSTFYNESMLDLCVAPGNSGPSFLTQTNLNGPCGSTLHMNNGVSDTIDHDILTYELISVRDNRGSIVTYTYPFDSAHPLTPYCPYTPGSVSCGPVINAKPPRGFYYNKVNGDIIFTPNNCNEVAVICMQATEWRNINGVKKIIGTFIADYLFTSLTQGYYMSTLTMNVKKSWSINAGEKLTIPASAFNADTLRNSDTAYLTWNRGIEKGKFTSSFSGKTCRGQFSWTPSCSDARTEPYHFVVSATNSRGNLMSEDVTINVLPQPTLIPDTIICNLSSLKLQSLVTGKYLWSTGDTSRSITINSAGTYSIKVTTSSCVLNDTIKISSINTLPIFSIGKDTLICEKFKGITATFKTTVLPNYSYSWVSKNQTGNGSTFTTNGTGNLILKATNVCGSKSDTLKIERESKPDFVAEHVILCPPFSYRFSVNRTNGTTYTWSTGSMDTSILIKTSGRYILEAVNRCFKYTDTFTADTVLFPKVYAGKDTTLCSLAKIILIAKGDASTYEWIGYIPGDTLIVSKSGTYILKGFNSCKTTYDTVKINIFSVSKVNLGPDRSFCDSISLIAGNSNNIILWDNGSTFPKRTIKSSGTFSVKVSNSCITTSDTVKLKFKTNPIVNLGPDISVSAPFLTKLDAGNAGNRFKWFGYLSGDTFQTFNATKFGTYIVRSYNECGQDFDTINILDASLGFNNYELSSITVYPNPASDFIFINNIPSDVSIEKAELISATGQYIDLPELNKAGLDIRNVIPGFYILKLYSNKGNSLYRVVVE
ncbi:MAG: T9SS type A sorting domain-containing protein [Bacteroidia bacterium]|nr:T9SS type A sorting domain-containing protein [Bacteroidia bacterium]